MANTFPAIAIKLGGLTSLLLTLSLLVSPPNIAFSSTLKALKYKKNTVIDFDEALVEGKSRKPYSEYLYKQKEQLSAELLNWEFDFNKNIEFSAQRISEQK